MPATDEYWRNLPRMHRLFAGSAFVLLACTLLLMYKDESREWRVYQKQAETLKLKRLEDQKRTADSAEYQAQLDKLKSERAAAIEALAPQQDQIDEIENAIPSLQSRVDILAVDSKAKNAQRDKARADYDIAVRDQLVEARIEHFKNIFDESVRAADAKALELEQARTALNSRKSDLSLLKEQVTAAESAIAKAEASLKAIEEQIQLLQPTSDGVAFKRWLKQVPIIEAFNPIHKIQYDWPSDLEQGLGMALVSRVDRCRSCHVNIADFGAGNVPSYPAGEGEGKYQQPFSAHPRPDLYLTATSPHPIDKFGCTVCHEGDGSGTSFQNAEHTPANPAQAEEWEKKYGWHSNHFWEYPMHPRQTLQSSCLKCHHNTVELGQNAQFGPSAPKVFEGYELIAEYGCFGCHEVNGYDGAKPIGPDLRLEPGSPEELAKIEADPNMVAGKMRKVGPSLRHVASKTTPEFIAYWTEDPQRFRPSTRMPKFFDLTNQHDALAGVLQPVELAGIAKYLAEKSQPLELLTPQEGYMPDAERGKAAFTQRGCLACHSHNAEDFKGITQNFGPELSRVHEKVKPGPEGFNWLYTWLREPSRYHTRTRMPDLMLTPTGEGDAYADPAADIAAFLLAGGPKEFPALAKSPTYIGVDVDPDFTLAEASELGIREKDFAGVRVTEVLQGSPASRAERKVRNNWVATPLQADDVITQINGQPVKSPESLKELESALATGSEVTLTVTSGRATREYRVIASTPLEDLTRYYLRKSLTQQDLDTALADKSYPLPDGYKRAKAAGNDAPLSTFIKGDEIELVNVSGEAVDAATWEHRQLVYIGRRTISRYGCYGCHDIPGFEDARPIGTALQDWGRKDTSKLAFEHIHEYLHHHGEPKGGSLERAEKAVVDALSGSDDTDQEALAASYFIESVTHHGRPGFVWQKLREPRSYDYHKTETKGWDERLRMPKFPFSEAQIEAVSTFVLGLVADPPKPAYQFRPDGSKGAIIEGERLLAKYNCAGCHLLEMPTMKFGADLDQLSVVAAQILDEEKPAWELLEKLKPTRNGLTGETAKDGQPMLEAHGFIQQYPDPQEDPEFQLYSFVLWDAHRIKPNADTDEGAFILPPGQPLAVEAPKVHSQTNGRGGDFSLWLAPQLVGQPGVTNMAEAWQAAVPPLYKEGTKVQTPWLYQFLQNPEQLRYTTVLRMPRFNMSAEEAQSLANYFAAIDAVPFPYQAIPPQQPEVKLATAKDYAVDYPDASHDYLTASWMVLNGPLCRQCHSVGGNPVAETDPTKLKRGPNLQRVEKRLRPEWVQLWVYNPKWVTPYTSMPINFPAGKKSQMVEMFNGDNMRQAESVIDALFNYTYLMETHGVTTYNPPGVTPTPDPAAAAPATGGDE